MIQRILPTTGFYQGVAKWSLKNIKEKSGADMVGFIPQQSGQIEPKPMKIKRRDEDGSEYFATIGNDIEYDPGPQDISTEFIGDVPVGFFVDDPPRQTSLLKARIRDAVDLGQHQALYSEPEVELHEHIQVPPGAVEGSEAVADGGNVQGQVIDRQYSVEHDELPEDYVLDLSSDSEGARVSWRRTCDILPEVATTDEMKRQEDRGELAGQAGNEDKAMRIMIYALLAIVAVVFIFFLGPSIINGLFGGEALAGGNPIPIGGG